MVFRQKLKRNINPFKWVLSFKKKMNDENSSIKRKNPFRKIYNNESFKNVLEHRENLVGFPFLVDVELTNKCNLKCIFCGQQTMGREKGFMEEEVFKKIIDECVKYSTPVRLIRWGEPFLHPKIIEFCKYAKEKGLLLHITTNGLAIREEQMLEVINLGVDSIIFSFQGATKEEYQLMRNNNFYDKLKENIFKFVELRKDKIKPFIHISTTVTNESAEQIKEFKEYWEDKVDSVGVGKTNFLYLSANQIKSFELANKLESLKEKETIQKVYRPCIEVYRKLSVNWDGKVSACCGDFDDFLIVGDINKSSLENIWNNSEELKIFRKLLDKNKHKCLTLCSKCYWPYEEFG